MTFSQGSLVISLGAIRRNWRALTCCLSSYVECAAVVKANAYGLGAEKISQVLFDEGCRHFYVANLDEALTLKKGLSSTASIYVFGGVACGEEEVFIHERIIPVIVSTDMLHRWAQACDKLKPLYPSVGAALMVDTGMGRYGVEPREYGDFLSDPDLIERAGIFLVLSHLACGDTPAHGFNRVQRRRFDKFYKRLQSISPNILASLANSSGVFLPKNFHFDMVRPGIAIYGGNPWHGSFQSPVETVVSLQLPVVQVRYLQQGDSVGYGCSYMAKEPRRVVTVAGGYGDGLPRALGEGGYGYLKGCKIPIIGRVSMDSIVLDVSDVDAMVNPGDKVELLGENISVDDMADVVGTIGYEILTSLGHRYVRRYV